jgi:hypothetical protein
VLSNEETGSIRSMSSLTSKGKRTPATDGNDRLNDSNKKYKRHSFKKFEI